MNGSFNNFIHYLLSHVLFIIPDKYGNRPIIEHLSQNDKSMLISLNNVSLL